MMILKAFVKLSFSKTGCRRYSSAAKNLQISGQNKIKRIKILCSLYYTVNKISYFLECIFISLSDHYICSHSREGFLPLRKRQVN